MTAVEWLDEQIQERVIAQDVVARKMIIEISIEDYMDVKRLAKEMEKQQIIDAYWGGLNGSINDYSESKKVGSEIIDIKYGKGADQYYNETYGSKESDELHEDNLDEMPTSSQTEISDEEIEKAVNNPNHDAYDFREGAKWYREQLRNK